VDRIQASPLISPRLILILLGVSPKSDAIPRSLLAAPARHGGTNAGLRPSATLPRWWSLGPVLDGADLPVPVGQRKIWIVLVCSAGLITMVLVRADRPIFKNDRKALLLPRVASGFDTFLLARGPNVLLAADWRLYSNILNHASCKAPFR